VATALVLFDDSAARQWQPFALTRPAGELLFGAMTLVERAERLFGLECIGHISADHLIDFHEPGGRPVVSLEHLPRDRDLIFWSSRAAAYLDQDAPAAESPVTYAIDGEPVGFFLPAGQLPAHSDLEDLSAGSLPATVVSVEGTVLGWVWDLMLGSAEQTARDLNESPATGSVPTGAHIIGDGALILARDVYVEPGVLFDTRDGPIRIAEETEVRTTTRLAGPVSIGPRSRLLGGSFERVSTGPYTYLRGEVVDSVVLGYSNKAHDGHIGHAYLGRWVNLGAMTTNSDLKNNYSAVRVWTPAGVRDTGHRKIGCFLGDHAKTGIGLVIGTGAVVGAGANLYGTAMPPGYVQPFSWGEGRDLGEYQLSKFLSTAAAVMERRGVDLDERGQRYLESCWRKGRGG
jgi:UDP-N-acetylglucosamine diphosphorylase/glucosamine-1-phosphate N-acetyltransferase